MRQEINFGYSLNEILNSKNIKVKDFANAINVSQATVYSWLSNSTEPNLTYLVTAADFLKCTIEFLIGRSDEDIIFEGKNLPLFVNRVKDIMKEADISSYKLRKISKYDGAYFYNWEHGSEPQLSTLAELSNILECSIDYLIGRV